MALTLYGSHRSRTMRILWVLEELGLPFEHEAWEHDDPRLKSSEYLARFPAGTIPAIDDNGFALSESLAITTYLCETYQAQAGVELLPDNPPGRAEVNRWTLWAQAALEPWVQRDSQTEAVLGSVRELALDYAAQGVATLEAHLGSAPWMLGERFTVADLNVASVLSPSRSSRLDLTPFPKTADWLARCRSRPAAAAVRERYFPRS